MNGYITVIGSLNYDILFSQERMPVEGETYTAESVVFSAGGKGANQAVQCSKLGAKTYMIGKIGEDFYGEHLLESLEKYGVDATHVKAVADNNTGIGSVNVLKDGAVFATISTGANFSMHKEDIDTIDDIIKNSKIIILQLEIPEVTVEYIVEKSHNYGVYTVLNAAPAKKLSKDCLSKIDCFVVNETEATFYAKTEIKDLKSAVDNYDKILFNKKGTLIITLGKSGSLLCDKDGYSFIEAISAGKAVDSLGAGDSYIGAFSYKKLEGESDLEACKFASKIAGMTVTKKGAQPAMPTAKDLDNN